MSARVLALAGLVACASSAPTASPVLSAPPVDVAAPAKKPPRDARVDRALEEMSHVRELSILRDVGVAVVTRAELMRALEAHVAREVPRAEIENEASFLKTLGVLGPRDDYERDVYALVRRTAGGMYLPECATMFLPGDLGGESLATSLAHEAVHALQDQHFGLEAFEKYVAGESDTMLARACLAEGDATSATDEEPAAADGSYVDRELAAPYVEGTAFVRALRTHGGWAEVDRAWTRGGLTTEQILHPEKWARAEAAVSVPPPSIAALGSGFSVAARDTRGELGLRLVLESGAGRERGAAGASGWAGDTAVLAAHGSTAAVAWRIRWDDESSARRGESVLAEVFTRGRPCSSERASPAAVSRDGRDALLLVGPPGSSCALLAGWSKEVFARGSLP